MATMQPAPKASICREKVRLTDAVVEALSALTELHSRQMANLLNGGDGLDRMEMALKLARKRRDDARDALAQHTRMHGC